MAGAGVRFERDLDPLQFKGGLSADDFEQPTSELNVRVIECEVGPSLRSALSLIVRRMGGANGRRCSSCCNRAKCQAHTLNTKLL